MRFEPGGEGEKILDTGHPGPRLLEVFHLMPDSIKRLAEQFGVGEHKVHRANGQRAVTKETRAEPIDERGADGEDNDIGGPQDRPAHESQNRVRQPGPQVFGEPAHKETRRAV